MKAPLRNYLGTISLILVYFLLSSSVATAAGRRPAKGLCARLLEAMAEVGIDTPLKLGDPVELKDFPYFSLEPGTIVHKLGFGHAGTVFRIEPPGGEPYIYKIYDRRSGPHDYEPDLQVLKILSGLKGDPEAERFHYLRDVKAGEDYQGKNTLRLSNSEGWPLDEVLEKWNLTQREKARLIELYNDRQWTLLDDLEQQYSVESEIFPPDGDLQFLEMNVKVYRKGTKELLFTLELSENNVLVDPRTLEMTIFDPR